ncbi:uncharacterized protein LOC115594270 isoform X2 [Sparus aurata]|uniref:uncharacterized protein LOC115594270 isoform X2 n=1 Tax=Sparus aurata TaxID=8175 RepID=UPI0011C18A0B|nr:uncharacterized protein LOC115594270 isoform X2 [Sparus aurata]
MSDSELEELLSIADNKEVIDDLERVDDLLNELQSEEAAAPVVVAPTVRWKKRGSDGTLIHARPRSSRNQSTAQAVYRQTTHPTNTNSEVVFAPDVEELLQDLQHALTDTGDAIQDEVEAPASLQASSSWSTRKSLFSESWRAERPRLVNTTVAKEHVKSNICQQCWRQSAVIRCRDCRPRPFLCAGCDVSMHTRHPLHSRDASTAGFFQPIPPTTFVLNEALCPCERFVPVEIPERICGCPAESLQIKTGKTITVITMNGRHELSMPELACETCNAKWTAGINDILRSDYWPATLHFATIYATDVFFSFEEMKMAAPGLSCQAYLRMIDQRTVRFGRTGRISGDSFLKSFFEWEAVQYEVDSICKEEPFSCLACSPDMLAVSEEQPIFDGVFIEKDEDVTSFVNCIQSKTKHVSGKGICGGEWSAARETSHRSASKLDEEGLELAVCRHGVLFSALNMYRGEIFAYPLYLQQKLASSKSAKFFCMDVMCKYWPYLQRMVKTFPELEPLLNMKPFLSVVHAKAHDFKCEVKWSGAYQEGAGLTLGEEVEQVNAFLSRIAVTTKHMSKAGRTDMLTLLSMRWNRQKNQSLATSLSHRFLKTTKALEDKQKILESLKAELSVTGSQLEDWVCDVKEWAEEASTDTNDADALANRIEVLVASIKRRSQRLYMDTDSNKGRAKIRCKIRKERVILASYVEKYNKMFPSTEILCFETILSEDTAWPWQLPNSDSVDLRTKRPDHVSKEASGGEKDSHHRDEKPLELLISTW